MIEMLVFLDLVILAHIFYCHWRIDRLAEKVADRARLVQRIQDVVNSKLFLEDASMGRVTREAKDDAIGPVSMRAVMKNKC